MKNLLLMSLLLSACGDKEAEDTATNEEAEESTEEGTEEQEDTGAAPE